VVARAGVVVARVLGLVVAPVVGLLVGLVVGLVVGGLVVVPAPQVPPAALRETQRTASAWRLSTSSLASARVPVETVFSTRLR
jgi:tetrahydromethanopterin S-methyltransferase subunit C